MNVKELLRTDLSIRKDLFPYNILYLAALHSAFMDGQDKVLGGLDATSKTPVRSGKGGRGLYKRASLHA